MWGEGGGVILKDSNLELRYECNDISSFRRIFCRKFHNNYFPELLQTATSCWNDTEKLSGLLEMTKQILTVFKYKII